MSTHPVLPLFVDDFEAATAHLTAEEDGIYNRLLRLCWRTPGCSIPINHAWIARKIRLTADEFERVGKPVLKEFFKVRRGRFYQQRLTKEYEYISCKKVLRQNAGSMGGKTTAARKATKTNNNDWSNAALLEQQNGSTLPNPTQPIEEEDADASLPGRPLPTPAVRREDVERIWLESPRVARERSSRSDVERALKAAAHRGHGPDEIGRALRRYYDSEGAKREDYRAAKGVHRMIEVDRWQDWASEVIPLAKLTPIEQAAHQAKVLAYVDLCERNMKNGT